jgi:Zn-dependent protease/CBS domain-containing protein
VRWSWKIATLAGIPLRVHATFFLIFPYAWFGEAHGDPARGLEAITLILGLFTCLVLHELGHALTARRFGVRTRDITLLPIGGVARLERIPEKPSQEIAVALAGPAVNVVIASILLGVITVTGNLRAFTTPYALEHNLVTQLAGMNVLLVVFNMIPAFPMDGGRVLRALLATRLDYLRATRIAASIGQGIAVLFGLLGLVWNPMLLFIAMFVFIGAGQESAAVQMRSAFDGVPVWRAMIRDYRALRGEEPLSRAVELLLSGHQQDFPVIGLPGDPPVGILLRADLIRALSEGKTNVRVDEIARRTCGTAHPREMLEAAFLRMQESGCAALPVLEEDGALVGMLTLENVGELAMVQAALGSARSRQAAV